MNTRRDSRGFSLIELIVVIAIVTSLAGLLVPQFVKYVTSRREQACDTNKQTILNVYEKCVYSGALEVDAFQDLMDAVYGSMDDFNNLSAVPIEYKQEVKDHLRCSSGGRYNVDVAGTTAYIWCDCGEHNEKLSVDFAGWDGGPWEELGDTPYPKPSTIVTTTPSTSPSPSVEPSPSKGSEPSDSFWPYSDDSRWDGKRQPGSSIRIYPKGGIPTGLFAGRSNDGAAKVYYCLVKREGTDANGDYFTVHYEQSEGPHTQVKGKSSQFIVQWSGRMYNSTTIENCKDQVNWKPGDQVYFVADGDIYVDDEGNRWIYWQAESNDAEIMSVQIPPHNSNWYKMGEDIVD